MLTASLKPYRIPTLLVTSSLGWIGLISMGVATFFGGSFTTALLVAAGLVLAGTVFCLVTAREVRNAPDLTEQYSPAITARKPSLEQQSFSLADPASSDRLIRGQLTVSSLSCRIRLQDGKLRQPLVRRRARSKVARAL